MHKKKLNDSFWKNVKIPSSKKYLEHLNKFNQYTDSPGWNEWYSRVAPLKATRVAKTILQYKDRRAKVLDLGCGIGFTLGTISQVFPNTIGCEVDSGVAYAAKEFLKKNFNKNIQIKIYNGRRLPFPSKSFDVVTSIEVIEHTDKPDIMLREIRRVLKSKGIVHISTANKWWPIEPHFKLPFLSYLPSKLADFYVKASGKGESYQDIHLPSYGQFYKILAKYFYVTDITLKIIKDHQIYGFSKERGKRIKYLALFLHALSAFKKNKFLKKHIEIFENFLLKFSPGWLLIGQPK